MPPDAPAHYQAVVGPTWLRHFVSPPTVFLSSTFLDLKYERRFVIKWLRARGFQVAAMEDLDGRHLYWQEWSQNRARQCDIYLNLYDRRVGTGATFMGFGGSISSIERRFADPYAARLVSYELSRPFPDCELLVEPSEREDYLATLDVSEPSGGSDRIRWVERSMRTGVEVSSVADLEAHLIADVRLTAAHLASHRSRAWLQSYFRPQSVWRQCAFEDEHYVAGSERPSPFTARGWCASAVTIAALVVISQAISAAAALTAALAFVIIVGAATVVWAPSSILLGSKTVVARGAFGLRTIRQMKGHQGRVVPRWGLLERWCGLGAASVMSDDGTVFVPFIGNARRLAYEAELPPQSDRMPPPPLTEVQKDRIAQRVAASWRRLEQDDEGSR